MMYGCKGQLDPPKLIHGAAGRAAAAYAISLSGETSALSWKVVYPFAYSSPYGTVAEAESLSLLSQS